ncbi:DUF3054 family protein [Frigoribacterium sp. PhB160]|uniref:DUF3054 domain-containing protein n=1 Tax=Frigoribacterium sp. PhB160 TaxID=2485192 RepID=UPI000F49F051|nr:DUF3054 domain-containing protein [Frigoribacterium sp. PhB160]ROS59522.1 DUF3054 family protein [Frigoribacterium sp. PhB160]
MTAPTARRAPARAFVIDLALVVAFVLIGRRSHAEGVDPAGLATTLWPFAVGLVVGWLSVLGVRWPLPAIRSGGVVVVSTVVLGMLLRVVSGQGVQPSFVVVTVVVLAVFLVGWRALATLLRRRGRGARA